MSRVPIRLRHFVQSRSNGHCEYCLVPELYVTHGHEPDHIIPSKHDGATTADNLAWACFRCNRYKSSDVGSYDSETGLLTPFFNPRTQLWHEHFNMSDGVIHSLSAEARVTIKILRLNMPKRVSERRQLIKLGLL